MNIDIKKFLDDVWLPNQDLILPAKFTIEGLDSKRLLQASSLFCLAQNMADIDGLQFKSTASEHPLWNASSAFPDDLLSLIVFYEMTFAVSAGENGVDMLELLNNISKLGLSIADTKISDEQLVEIIDNWQKMMTK